MNRRHYYAIEYAYGIRVVNRGNRADKLVRFRSRSRRDHWVAMGPFCATEAGYREIVGSGDQRVRRVLRLMKESGASWMRLQASLGAEFVAIGVPR